MYPLKTPILVTCGLPYANGPCHVGHLRTYIPADIYVRMLKKLGQEVTFVCGSDTHGTPIIMNAESLGITPTELVDKYHNHFEGVFKTLGVNFDSYGRTDSKTNHNRTTEIVNTLLDNGYIYPKIIKLAYCPNCDKFLPDRYVQGTCPYCESVARGDECDQGCGRHLEPGELKSPICTICSGEAEFRDQEHYFFKLSVFQDGLLEHLKSLKGTSNARNYAKQWVSTELRDWCITRNLDWGVPFPGRDDLVVYVWIDAPIGYISFTEDWSSEWVKYWKGDGKIVHFIGGDIIYHHCVFWPAMLKGAGYSTPWAVVASGMVKIDDKTFSKSRGYVVWVIDDYLDHGLHPDLLRYYLASYTSHTKELNFSWQVFQEKVNSELVGILGNFAYRVLLFAFKNFGEIPDGEIGSEVKKKIRETEESICQGLEEYEFKKMIDSAMSLAIYGNSYFQSHEPWHLIKEDKTRCGEVIKNCLQIIKALSIFMEPVMPEKMQTLWGQLGLDSEIHKALMSDSVVEIESKTKLAKPALLFKKIEDEKREEMEEILRERVSKADGGGATKEEVKDEKKFVSFDDFQKFEIIVGVVKSAEAIKGSDKLLKLMVDLGEEELRQIVAGIAMKYKAEDLVDSQVTVISNLEPAKIFGTISNGMLLAAGDDAVLIRPDGDVTPGTRVG
ncbi:MAG: methionine--tRNA ligase [Halobacteriota archaeon]|nr:methionine--tRNA ligase [Halobacteriota archaeon]